MEHRATYLEVSPDDLEETTMSVHMSSIQPSLDVMDSLGIYHPANAKKQLNITAPMAFAALCASLANLARGFVLGYSSPSIPELEAEGLLANSDQVDSMVREMI
jgi:hypothetical protein